MRTLRQLLAIAAVTAALAVSAKADLRFIGAVNFNNGPNDPATNADALATFHGFKQTSREYFFLFDNYESGLSGPVTATLGYEFFVVHYGQGEDGTGDGGSLEFFALST